jgi:hypothetical protein
MDRIDDLAERGTVRKFLNFIVRETEQIVYPMKQFGTSFRIDALFVHPLIQRKSDDTILKYSAVSNIL